jgi:hypothetical protein
VYDIGDLGIRYDGAYWVSGLHVRPADEARALTPPQYQNQGDYINGPGADVAASIDVASHALPGRATGTSGCGQSTGLGGSTGGNPYLQPTSPTPNSYQCQAQTFSPADGNALDLRTVNLDAGALDTSRAGINPLQALTISATGDGPFTLTLTGYSASQVSGSCESGQQTGSAGTTVTLNLGSSPCQVTLEP